MKNQNKNDLFVYIESEILYRIRALIVHFGPDNVYLQGHFTIACVTMAIGMVWFELIENDEAHEFV